MYMDKPIGRYRLSKTVIFLFLFIFIFAVIMPPKGKKSSVGAKARKSVVIWSRMNLVTNDSDPTFSEGDDPVVVHEVQNTS